MDSENRLEKEISDAIFQQNLIDENERLNLEMAIQAQRIADLEKAQLPEKQKFFTRFFTGGKSISKIERGSINNSI